MANNSKEMASTFTCQVTKSMEEKATGPSMVCLK